MLPAQILRIKASGKRHSLSSDKALYFVNATGAPWVASYIQSKGDPITDIHQDIAAEQKARSAYEYLIRLSDDPDVTDVLRFLWQRKIVIVVLQHTENPNHMRTTRAGQRCGNYLIASIGAPNRFSNGGFISGQVRYGNQATVRSHVPGNSISDFAFVKDIGTLVGNQT
ncbi:MAG TPA: hypothetical protein GX510_04325 [Firmicutes bacterium]|nr:hypothetical protein [Candidatus Fermentithermobacillaceae bacterium]